MSVPFVPIPASVTWLQTADPQTVQWEHFAQCILDYVAWLRASGVPEERIGDPYAFIEPGDLQNFINVVNWWPKDAPPSHRAPTLYGMLVELNLGNGALMRSFGHTLDWHVERVKEWMVGARKDPSNPNETKDEKATRLNRERVARHRLRHMDHSTDDPVLNQLIVAAKHAEQSASAGRKWIKGEIHRAKSDMEATILAAKSERVARVKRAEEALALAERQAVDAQELVRQYNPSK